MLINSCSSPAITTSGLVVDQRVKSYRLDGKSVSKDTAYDYLDRNADSNPIIVIVDGMNVTAFRYNEANLL